MVNIFPKDITLWFGQDSNPEPSVPDPNALTTRPQCTLRRPANLYDFLYLNTAQSQTSPIVLPEDELAQIVNTREKKSTCSIYIYIYIVYM